LSNEYNIGHCRARLQSTGRLKNTWEKDPGKEMWRAAFRYSWKKIETAAHDRAGWRQVVCGLCSNWSDKA